MFTIKNKNKALVLVASDPEVFGYRLSDDVQKQELSKGNADVPGKQPGRWLTSPPFPCLLPSQKERGNPK